MTVETKTLKKEHRAKKQKQRDKAQKILFDSHPETMRIAVNVAHGVARDVICPHCQGEFSIKVGDNSNKEILKTLIEQVEGKPKQTTEVDLNAKFELDSSQLLRLFNRLEEFRKEQASVTISAIEAEFKALPEPKLPEVLPVAGMEKVILAPPVTIKPQPLQEIKVTTSGQYAVKE